MFSFYRLVFAHFISGIEWTLVDSAYLPANPTTLEKQSWHNFLADMGVVDFLRVKPVEVKFDKSTIVRHISDTKTTQCHICHHIHHYLIMFILPPYSVCFSLHQKDLVVVYIFLRVCPRNSITMIDKIFTLIFQWHLLFYLELVLFINDIINGRKKLMVNRLLHKTRKLSIVYQIISDILLYECITCQGNMAVPHIIYLLRFLFNFISR